MKWVGLISVGIAWGAVSAIFFFRFWMAFLGSLACLIGFYRGRVLRRVVARHLLDHITRELFYGLGLLLGFWVLYQVLPCGRTQGEIIGYWVSAMVAEVVLLSRISGRIDEIWRQVNGPDDDG